jgi:hypothetical protein
LWASLLGYPALFVVEYIISPNPILVLSFGIVQFSSIWCRYWQQVSYGQSQYLPPGSVYITHTVSKSMLHKYVVQLTSTLISWCLPCVQSPLRFSEPCVGDNQSISFTKVNKNLTSVILSS